LIGYDPLYIYCDLIHVTITNLMCHLTITNSIRGPVVAKVDETNGSHIEFVVVKYQIKFVILR